MDEAEGIQCLGDTNRTICSLLSSFCYNLFHLFTHHPNCLLRGLSLRACAQANRTAIGSAVHRCWVKGKSLAISPESSLMFWLYQGIYDLQPFKLDLLLPDESILVQIFCTSITCLPQHNKPFLIPQRVEAQEGTPPKVNQTQGFLTPGYTSWPFCSLLNSFYSPLHPASL